MSNQKIAMSSYKAQVKRYGSPISKDLYRELREYAKKHGVKISGFKSFVGDISVIKTVIDDISRIAVDFPAILKRRSSVCLELDYDMGQDYATTESGNIIHLNAVFYAKIEVLEDDYNEAVRDKRFVRDTNWRSIIRHEVGHVVADAYRIKPMEIAMELLKAREAEVLDVLTDELSLYSTEYEDGREIISECFSAYYSNVRIGFADRFIERCLEISKERR